MTSICVQPDFLLGLLTEIGRHRALADHETDMIEAIVCRGHRPTGLRRQWTRAMDRKLIKAATRRGGIKAFAQAHGISHGAAIARLCRVRKATLRASTNQGRIGV